MSILDVLQLVGNSTGATITLWMAALLMRRRHLRPVERVLIVLGICIGCWHISNLLIALHDFLGFSNTSWIPLLRVTDSVAVIAITLTYSLLLHVHIHLWVDAKNRKTTWIEEVRIYLSYIPNLFLFLALPHIWRDPYLPMLEKFSIASLPELPFLSYLLAFSLWATYVLMLIAVTDLLIARNAETVSEKRFLIVLSASFLVVACLVFLHGAAGVGNGTKTSEYLKTLANLGALLPTGLIVYYVYRYRYLDLVIRDSLVFATFSVVILTAYLVMVRSLGTWLSSRFGLRSGAVESLLILGLALIAAPLKRWLDRRFHEMFETEASLYREVVARVSNSREQFQNLPDLLAFIEHEAVTNLGVRRLRIIPSRAFPGSENEETLEGFSLAGLIEAANAQRDITWLTAKHHKLLEESGFDYAMCLRRDSSIVGLMLLNASEDVLTPGVRSVLDVLAGQIAIALHDAAIIEENVNLERQLAQGQRLAELGQMAATVAHEVRNPLSAIKSIAQVMREDVSLAGEYSRDLELIVGETDRLSQSVSQLLSFARASSVPGESTEAATVVRAVGDICLAEAKLRRIDLCCTADSTHLLTGVEGPSLKDALTNLTLNAIHATPEGGQVAVGVTVRPEKIVFTVDDSGPGIEASIRSRIWDPFFTTKQRGTGLGLAIAQKRMHEIGGLAVLAADSPLGGSRFELWLPVSNGIDH